MNLIPKQYRYLFGDTNPNTLSIQNNRHYFIERILEYVDFDADSWLINNIYTVDDFKDADNDSDIDFLGEKVSWSEVKRYVIDIVNNYVNQYA